MTNAEEIVYRFRFQIAFLLIGFLAAAFGLFLFNKNEPAFEVVGEEQQDGKTALVIEVSGAVESPGVYEMPANSRVEDALLKAGGISEGADTNWVEKYLNKASFVADGQKIYVPSQSEASSANNVGGDQGDSNVLGSASGSFININTASQEVLESLKGIGPVYAQKIIDNRPYSDVSELLVKKAVTQKIYDDNYERFSVY